MKFEKIFTRISPEELTDNVFRLVGKDFPVVTGGNKDHYNAMLASGGGMGMLFMKPTTWCIFPENRYTLEIIEQEKTYTLSYFSEQYREQIFFLGKNSGRDSNKMKEVVLKAISTPCGNMTFQEARLVIECRLTQGTIARPEDFYDQEAKDLTIQAYNEIGCYRKFVFGEITDVWIK